MFRQNSGIFMKRILVLSGASLVALAVTSCSTYQKSEAGYGTESTAAFPDLVQYAKPMCGTGTAINTEGGDNNTFPGAVAPFGMVQWSPDTDNGMHRGGYGVNDKTIGDFSVDHLSGTGCHYGADFAFMPIPGQQPASPPVAHNTFAVPFSHAKEIAKPGYYGVTLNNGVIVELTATTRSGFGRFIFPSGIEAATMMINTANDACGAEASGVSLNPATREISGWSVGGHFCGTQESRTIYFYAVFDRPFKSWSTWSNKKTTKGTI